MKTVVAAAFVLLGVTMASAAVRTKTAEYNDRDTVLESWQAMKDFFAEILK
jgi:hypothetical protein